MSAPHRLLVRADPVTAHEEARCGTANVLGSDELRIKRIERVSGQTGGDVGRQPEAILDRCSIQDDAVGRVLARSAVHVLSNVVRDGP
jgi:hypothetical protein